jgi:hypothetical protein
MNKSILTLFFVLLVGFPQVSSGEKKGKEKKHVPGSYNYLWDGSNEVNLKCIPKSEEQKGIQYYINIKYKEKIISEYIFDNLMYEYKTTKVGERFVEGSVVGKYKRKHFIRIDRYSGIYRYSNCDTQKDGDCEKPTQKGWGWCEVIERKF